MDNSDRRIIVLETKMEAMQREFAEAREQHRKDMDRVFAKLDDIKEDVSKNIPCPAPGACLRIEKDVHEVIKKVDVLEASRNRAVGERTITGGLAGLVGAGVVAFFAWLLSRLGGAE